MSRDTDDMFSEACFEVGWLKQTIRTAEEKLSRLDRAGNKSAQQKLIEDVIRGLREGREGAQAAARTDVATSKARARLAKGGQQ